MIDPPEISDKYTFTPEEAEEFNQWKKNKVKQKIRKDGWKHGLFYGFLVIFYVLNYVACSCEFQICGIKFKGVPDWKCVLCLLILQLIFLLVWGARNGIDHLQNILEKIASIKNPSLVKLKDENQENL